MLIFSKHSNQTLPPQTLYLIPLPFHLINYSTVTTLHSPNPLDKPATTHLSSNLLLNLNYQPTHLILPVNLLTNPLSNNLPLDSTQPILPLPSATFNLALTPQQRLKCLLV